MSKKKHKNSDSNFALISSGALSSLVIIPACLGYATLVFSGDLQKYLPLGITVTLIGAVFFNFITAIFSKFKFTTAQPPANLQAVLALMLTSIVQQLTAAHLESAILPTVLATICITTVVVGAALFFIGFFKVGNFIRFIPYPVICGYFSGAAWIIIVGAVTLMIGKQPSLEALLTPQHMLAYIPGVALGILIFASQNFSRNPLLPPAILVIAALILHLLLTLAGVSLQQAGEMGWLFPEMSLQFIWQEIDINSFTQIAWSEIFSHTNYLLSVIVIGVITTVFSLTGLEVFAKSDIDIDKSLRVSGASNMLIGLNGSLVFNRYIPVILPQDPLKKRNCLIGLTTALFCFLALLAIPAVLFYFPKLVIASLLVSLALTVLKIYIYRAWLELSKTDFAIIVAILLSIMQWGFVFGVVFGIVICCFIFIIKYSLIEVVKYTLTGKEHHSNQSLSLDQLKFLAKNGEQLLIKRLQGYLFFGTAYLLERKIKSYINSHKKTKFILIDFGAVTGMDASAHYSFMKIKQLTAQKNITFILTNLSKEIKNTLEKSKIIKEDYNDFIVFPDMDRGMAWYEQQALSVREDLLLKSERDIQLQLAKIFKNEKQKNCFIQYLEKKECNPQSYLFKENDPADHLLFVESGEIEIMLKGKHKRKKRLRAIGPGSIVGEMGLYTPEAKRTASAYCKTHCSVYKLTLETLEKIRQENPDIVLQLQRYLIETLVERLAHTSSELELLSR